MSEEKKNISDENERIQLKRKRAQAQRKKRRNRKIIMVVMELILLMIVAVCAVLLYGLDKIIVDVDDDWFVTNEQTESSSDNVQTAIETDGEGNTVVVDIDTGETEADTDIEADEDESYSVSFSDRYTTIVVFGMDGRGEVESYSQGSNSDVIILVSIDNETGEIRMSSVYRDSVMKVYGLGVDYYDKANYAICAYGVPLAVNTLNMNLDLDIDYFICVDWEASAELISALGGVDITLKSSFWSITNSDGVEVPYFNGLLTEIVENTGIDSAAIPEEYFVDGTVWHADGPQAVAYMRLRYSDSDIYRTQRQREVIDQVIQSAKTMNFATLLKIWNIVSNSVKMNISESDILGLLQNINNYYFDSDTGSQGYPTTYYDGASYPSKSDSDGEHATKWMMVPVNVVENVTELHEFLYPEEDYTPTDTLYQIAEEIREFGYFDENWELTID